MKPTCQGKPGAKQRLHLRRLLRRRSMTQQALADRTGIAYAVLCRLGRAGANPTLATLRRLARALKCSLDELAGKGGRRV